MKSQSPRSAFTLLELLVAVAITLIMVALMASIANFTTRAWQRGEGKAETNAGARGALALIGRELQGAVIDNDLGFIVQTVPGESNNFVLKFLSRREPQGQNVAAVEKVAYQLAWASTSLLPQVTTDQDKEHPIPVLIRTSNSDAGKGLYDVFNANGSNYSWTWARDWGNLPSGAPVQTGQKRGNGDVTEVVAENVLGWRIKPLFWKTGADGSTPSVAIDDTSPDKGGSEQPRYFDDSAAATAKYITSDLKYVKEADPILKNISASEAPRALEIEIAALPSRVLPRAITMDGWSGLRAKDDLFDPNDWSDSPLDKLMKQGVQILDASYYLISRTP